jgi:hypothetical protein
VTGPGFTRHAQARLQQRAIPPLVVELLERVGSATRADGADILFFDKAARKRLRRHLGGERSLKPVERWLNVYVVVADGGPVVTAGHRHRRIQRDR